jgi:hypothetical protein
LRCGCRLRSAWRKGLRSSETQLPRRRLRRGLPTSPLNWSAGNHGRASTVSSPVAMRTAQNGLRESQGQSSAAVRSRLLSGLRDGRRTFGRSFPDRTKMGGWRFPVERHRGKRRSAAGIEALPVRVSDLENDAGLRLGRALMPLLDRYPLAHWRSSGRWRDRIAGQLSRGTFMSAGGSITPERRTRNHEALRHGSERRPLPRGQAPFPGECRALRRPAPVGQAGPPARS